MDFSFHPDKPRATQIDLRMRHELAQSLRYLSAEIDGRVEFDSNHLDGLIDDLEQGCKYPASVFALYTDLVFALSGQLQQDPEEIIHQLLQQKILGGTLPHFETLGSRQLQVAGERMTRVLDLDEDTEFLLQAPGRASCAAFEHRLDTAFALMGRALPDLVGEIRALVTQVIMVEPASGSSYTFDGGSSYMLWGGLFLNTRSYTSIAALVEVLAHESAHMLLYGFAANTPLTVNDESVRYASPLRPDPRPMEGIFHATFVTARMHYAMHQLLEYRDLNPIDRDHAHEALARNLEAFYDGYQTLQQHGELSEVGQALMQSCTDYMNLKGRSR